MDEFIEQFIIESREYLEQANAALHTLEDQSHDAPALEALFRSVHTRLDQVAPRRSHPDPGERRWRRNSARRNS